MAVSNDVKERTFVSNCFACGPRLCSKIRSVWNTFSICTALTVFCVILSLDLDPKNKLLRESTLKIESNPYTDSVRLQVSKTAAVAMLMAVLWVMTPIPSNFVNNLLKNCPYSNLRCTCSSCHCVGATGSVPPPWCI